MEDKRMKAWSDPELRFTKADRDQVFKKIQRVDGAGGREKKQSMFFTGLVPLTVSLVVVSICLILFLPSLLQWNVADQAAVSMKDQTALTGAAAGNQDVTTVLFSIKDEEDRVPVNLLFAYHPDGEKLKVLSIPRDTYASIQRKNEAASFDKLTFAYADGDGAEGVRATVSGLFNLPVDYYAVMDMEIFSAMLESVGGINYDLQEDLRVRAISQASFEFHKGANQLNGEEFLALVMDATVGNSLGDEELLQLLSMMITKMADGAALAQFKTEGNIPADEFLVDPLKIHSIQTVSMLDGIQDTAKDGKYYIAFEEDFLQTVSEELTAFK